MKMVKVKVDNHVERLLATGMIVSEELLRRLDAVFDLKLLESKYTKTVCEWAWDYWKKFHAPVGRHIEDLFREKERSGALPEETADAIADFLASISEEFERGPQFNAQYVYDSAERLFRTRQAQHLAEDVLAYVSQDRLDDAEDRLLKFRSVPKVDNTAFNILSDTDAIYEAFESETKPLFRFPGALGSFLNDQLVREGLLMVMGPEKRGKTWWLNEFAKQAVRGRCNVALFEVGDMSKSQIIRRFHISLAGKSDNPKYCGKFLVPVLDCAHNQTNECTLACRTSRVGLKDGEHLLGFDEAPPSYRACSACIHERGGPFQGAVWYREHEVEAPLTWREAIAHGRQWRKRHRGRDFKTVCVPNSSINVKGIERYLEGWEVTEGFLPDVVIIDYADILAPEDPREETRHQINATWKALRALSQRRKVLVIAATQSDAESYEAFILKMKNFSEDKRKFAHVTGTVGLNQTEDEKRAGIMRLNWIVLREGEFDVARTCTVLQSLRTGQTVLGSFWG